MKRYSFKEFAAIIEDTLVRCPCWWRAEWWNEHPQKDIKLPLTLWLLHWSRFINHMSRSYDVPIQ